MYDRILSGELLFLNSTLKRVSIRLRRGRGGGGTGKSGWNNMIITLCIFPLCFHYLCIQLCQPHLTIRVRFVNTFTWRVVIVDAANGRPSNRPLNQISTSKPACMLHLHPEPAAQDGCSWHLCRSTFHNKSTLVLMYSISIVIRCLQACVLMGSVRCKNPGPSQERPFQEEHTLGRGYKKPPAEQNGAPHLWVCQAVCGMKQETSRNNVHPPFIPVNIHQYPLISIVLR